MPARRRSACGVAVAMSVLMVSGCGHTGGRPAADEPAAPAAPAADDVVPLAPRLPADPSSAAPTPPPTAAGLAVAGPTAQPFAQGLTEYCTSFYTAQRDNEDQYPLPDPASQLAFLRGQLATSQRTQAQLETLTAPPSQADVFAQFVAVSDDILNDRVADLAAVQSGGQEDTALAALQADYQRRWLLAARLGATGCDGRLPPDQQAAAVQAVRAFETSPDSEAVCRELTTPGYLDAAWPTQQTPLLACIHDREVVRTSTVGLPSDITVSEVTGVEHVAATVHYSFVDGCGCRSSVTRLHYVGGHWKVSQVQG